MMIRKKIIAALLLKSTLLTSFAPLYAGNKTGKVVEDIPDMGNQQLIQVQQGQVRNQQLVLFQNNQAQEQRNQSPIQISE